ncbi:probable alpha,alpha-trehalose-phosphate synthase [UDP-forming] 9 [Phragmites australis]|uniref:probable alpha,alpha-trehalose-phosphate synthase [UDP-forming] 9 n=1 Tax=Phragmites australis TaxID=29695 RepID=UPI002D76A047|nr:probable alpha,alpha-trehalose-phosphate synthase [UDP-forming] 9 [Phragmites australis]
MPAAALLEEAKGGRLLWWKGRTGRRKSRGEAAALGFGRSRGRDAQMYPTGRPSHWYIYPTTTSPTDHTVHRHPSPTGGKEGPTATSLPPPMQGSSKPSCVNPSMAPAPPVPGADEPTARRIVAAHRLPLHTTPDPDSPFGFAFSLDPDALPLQLSRGLPVPVTFVGTLPASAASAVIPSDELDDYLMENFSCLPVHLDCDIHTGFYDGFCKHYLWPLLHYLLPLEPPDDHGGLRFNDAAYRSFIAANRRFADRVIEVLSPDDGDLVIVHDYHLWVLPTFLRRKCPRAGVGFFLHSPYPSADLFHTTPVREDLLRALLNADLIGFHTFDYAHHFLSSCSRLLGISSRSQRGHFGINYRGRTVLVKVLPVGVDMVQLRAALASPEAAAKAKEITEAYRGRKLMVGVDDVDLFKGISLKLQALEKLLETNADTRGKVVLVQINNPARSRGRDVDGVRDETDEIRRRINSRFGRTGYQPVHVIDGPVPMCEKAAYYAAADCCVVSAVRDGLNRIPYFYTVCREEGPAAAAAENGDSAAQRTSAVVVSEFVGCSPSLSGAIRVNPWNLEALAEAMHTALTMRTEDKQARHRTHYNYLSAHDVVAWAQSFDAVLQLACKDRSTMRFIGLGFGMSYRAIAVDASFKKLTPEHVRPAYCAAARRLILLDYDGTLVPEESDRRAPNVGVIDLLNELCSDPKNVVFVVSGRGKNELAQWFAPCEKLGISAEHGYFTRWSRGDPWESIKSVSGFAWKETVELVLKNYTESTDGSYIENKETAMVWHYQNADKKLGPCQAKELFDHLVDMLAKEPVSVSCGSKIVEVNPQGVTKGFAVGNLISAMARCGDAPDFIICVGDDQSDEAMFERLDRIGGGNKPPLLPAGAWVFACTVGNKPSSARFYLDEPEDVLTMLRGLAF